MAALVGGGGGFDCGVHNVVVAFRFPGHLTDPAGAWPSETRAELPGPLVYCPATVVAGVAMAALVAGVLWVWQRVQRSGTVHRRRPGVNPRA